MRPFLLLVTVLLACVSNVALAVQPDEILKDPALEARARDLSRELRCMVCQNQSIDNSEAPLARDIRVLVRERLTKGDSDQQVIDYLVARYGEFVLLKPRFELGNCAPLGPSTGGTARGHDRVICRGAAAQIGQHRTCDT